MVAFALTPALMGKVAAQVPQPKALIEEKRHDLGEVYEQDKYSHQFSVKNIGDADLKIEKVKPG